MNAPPELREAAVSGLFYPNDPVVLRGDVERLLGLCGKPPQRREVAGLVVPHAGYLYSGLTAASGYSCVSHSEYEAVIIVSPSHREYFEGCSVYPGAGYRTPLGPALLHEGIATELVNASSSLLRSRHGHAGEHAVEVQIPFLQVVLPGVPIVPVVMGNQHRGLCLDLASALQSVAGRHDVLLVASTDLSHFHTRTEAELLDTVTIGHLRALQFEQLLRDLEAGRTEACGGGPAAAVMAALAARGIREFEVLRYSTSGDVTGDDEQVVGYVSAAAYA